MRRSRLVGALVAMAIVLLAAATEARSAPPAQHATTPLERTVELMEALEHHRYTAACGVYDPVFWVMVGFAARDCESVLRKTFPRGEPVAYRVHFGGRVGARMAVVIASMTLGASARLCDRAWRAAQQCQQASTFYFELTRKTLLVDWRGRNVDAPQSRWYISSVGGV
jgi:hypothetical protein